MSNHRKARQCGNTMAATDMKERVRWELIRRMVETDLSFDHAGEIVDELGDTWCYLFAVHAGLLETGSDGLPLIHIERRRGGGDAFPAFCEAINLARQRLGAQAYH